MKSTLADMHNVTAQHFLQHIRQDILRSWSQLEEASVIILELSSVCPSWLTNLLYLFLQSKLAVVHPSNCICVSLAALTTCLRQVFPCFFIVLTVEFSQIC